MKVAIIGSRNLHVENFEKYLPEDVTEIVSGGAKGIDSDAEKYARENYYMKRTNEDIIIINREK